MSLRLRLTLLYSTLMGAILLVISAAVTLVIDRVLLQQLDETLEKSQQIVFKNIKEDYLGRVLADLTSNDMGYDVYLQIWGLNGEILYNPRPLNNFASVPFDESGLHQDYPCRVSCSAQACTGDISELPESPSARPVRGALRQSS